MIEFDDNDTDVDVDVYDDVDDAQEQKKTARWWSARDLHRRRFAFLSSL